MSTSGYSTDKTSADVKSPDPVDPPPPAAEVPAGDVPTADPAPTDSGKIKGAKSGRERAALAGTPSAAGGTHGGRGVVLQLLRNAERHADDHLEAIEISASLSAMRHGPELPGSHLEVRSRSANRHS